VSAANIAAYTLSGVGALTVASLNSTGDTTTARILTDGYYYANGVPVTFGSTSTYSNANVAAYLPTYTGNISANTIQAGNVSVTYTTTSGNLVSNGTVSAAGNITAAYFVGNGSALTGVVATNVGTLSTLTVTGNITAGNITAVHYGNGAGLTNLIGANITGTVANATYATSTGSATTASTVTGSAQGNITSVGLLTSLGVSGSISINQAANPTAIVNGGTAGVGNIGAAGAAFDTVFAKATTAQYADLAENYQADEAYAPGTVLSFGGASEVTISLIDGDVAVAGVVSTNPAYRMNDGLKGKTVVPIALQGRVPCRVVGPVTRGAMMVSNGDGRARAEVNPKIGSIIGKALESFDGELGTIEVVVGRL
jgi:hypothetical protein